MTKVIRRLLVAAIVIVVLYRAGVRRQRRLREEKPPTDWAVERLKWIPDEIKEREGLHGDV